MEDSIMHFAPRFSNLLVVVHGLKHASCKTSAGVWKSGRSEREAATSNEQKSTPFAFGVGWNAVLDAETDHMGSSPAAATRTPTNATEAVCFGWIVQGCWKNEGSREQTRERGTMKTDFDASPARASPRPRGSPRWACRSICGNTSQALFARI